jgi:hypothetical protein
MRHREFPDLFVQAARALLHRPCGSGIPVSQRPDLQPIPEAAVALGCTAGTHRSVAFAIILADAIDNMFPGIKVDLQHTNMKAWPEPCRLRHCTECSQLPVSLIRCILRAQELLDEV